MVSRDPERAELLGALLVDATDYDVIILESIARGYSRIKQMVPDLVVVSMEPDDIDACQLLSMLKADSELCGIRIVTWQTDGQEGEFEDIFSDPSRDSSRSHGRYPNELTSRLPRVQVQTPSARINLMLQEFRDRATSCGGKPRESVCTSAVEVFVRFSILWTRRLSAVSPSEQPLAFGG